MAKRRNFGTSASVSIRNIDQLLKEIDKTKAGVEKALKLTLSDARKAAPGIVADGVRTKYNIKKSDITNGKNVSVKTEGTSLEDMRLHYEGRMLTPVHFGMTPKSPPAGKSYTTKATILKGRKRAITRGYKNTRTRGGPFSGQSPFVLMGTGAKGEGTSHIPFQRQGAGHSPSNEFGKRGLKKMTTLSIPQMITNDEVAEVIQGKLSDKIKTRLDYHMSKL